MTEQVVPVLRGKMVRAVAAAKNAKTVRDRHAHWAEAGAYATALRLIRSGDTAWVDGIDGRFWGGEVKDCRDGFLNGDDRGLLGVIEA